MRWLHTRIDSSRNQRSHWSKSSIFRKRRRQALLDRSCWSHAAWGRSSSTLFRPSPRPILSPRIRPPIEPLLRFYARVVSYWYYKDYYPCLFSPFHVRLWHEYDKSKHHRASLSSDAHFFNSKPKGRRHQSRIRFSNESKLRHSVNQGITGFSVRITQLHLHSHLTWISYTLSRVRRTSSAHTMCSGIQGITGTKSNAAQQARKFA